MIRMRFAAILLFVLSIALPGWSAPRAAAPPLQTVCTITVNSADEKQAFRRHLPASKYRFVELVERGRSDWLASACKAKVRCDVLIVSGHYDGADDFFSDQLEVREHLPVAELERVSCSDSCPALFSQLKEVHLYGCNTLNPAPQSSASAEIVRSLVREGRSPKEAQRQLQSLSAAHGEASRDRMRQIFNGVPVIYGFSSAAPLGPVAGATLDRFFRAGGAADIGRGHPSGRLLGHFAPFALAAAQGIGDRDPQAGARADMCRFADDRQTQVQRLDFVHALMQRHSGESRLYLDRMLRLTAALDEPTRQDPAVAAALAAIAEDAEARTRFLDFTRNAEQWPVRARMLDLARDLGWLPDADRWAERARMLGDLQARREVGVPEVDLACALNQDHELDGTFARRLPNGGANDDVAHAAVRACLGSEEGRARTLAALAGTNEADVRAAQAFLRQRPITDTAELRRVATAIVRMAPSPAQVRALEVLGRHYLSDRQVLAQLARLYADTPSWEVQNAIAGILIRADRRAVASLQLENALREHRRRAPAGDSLVDALLQRVTAP
jgi:hypothetical protein